ncbi:type VI secretion system Vgr family protein [Taibaiella soli]|uniref:Gp5/Type VI secretion system Vgr protein OB-fold domain-containing protein n=1 Tax=Taibaiella soli TaxID=1649169 RepID=A0A2W2BBK5_9BACT|nr:phage baseplate assembly protein V [Taibaiella soli]PZF73589.1 hypothetical protein DN068_07655 [Taibaiella soli]
MNEKSLQEAASTNAYSTSDNGNSEMPAQERIDASSLVSSYEEIAWQIMVDGNNVKRIISFQLNQAFNSHHEFELKVYHTELESPRAYKIDKSKDLLGKTVTAILGTHKNKDITRFSGIITGISFLEGNGLYGEIALKGYSPTILLESGENMQSFYNKNLATVVKEVTQPLSGKLDLAIKPKFSSNIEYTAQHLESNFNFLNRMSAFYGEWFYYDGERLNFGKPSSQSSSDLKYIRHIQNLRMTMQMAPMNFTHVSYRHQDDQVLQKDAPQKVDGLNFYGDFAVQKSDETYNTVKRSPWQQVGDQGEMERAATVNKSAAAAQTFIIEGESRHPAPKPGAKIKIMFNENELGEYLVIEAHHSLDNVSNYTCAFRAVPAEIEVLPVAKVHFPVTETQLAIVKDNADPSGIGRVRVQFQWQEGSNMTSWIRVMTPDAGSSNAVNKNRGFVFIPEIGDQVIIGFERGNPDAPFVLGSLFHGKNGIGGLPQNINKSITTRSGHTIELNDDGEGTHIVIKDPGGNEIFLDTQAKNITITAPESINFYAKNIGFNAGENITHTAGDNVSISAGENMMLSATKDTMLTAANITEVASDNILRTASSIEKTAETVKVNSTKDNIEMHSSKQIVNHSGDNVKLF